MGWRKGFPLKRLLPEELLTFRVSFSTSFDLSKEAPHKRAQRILLVDSRTTQLDNQHQPSQIPPSVLLYNPVSFYCYCYEDGPIAILPKCLAARCEEKKMCLISYCRSKTHRQIYDDPEQAVTELMHSLIHPRIQSFNKNVGSSPSVQTLPWAHCVVVIQLSLFLFPWIYSKHTCQEMSRERGRACGHACTQPSVLLVDTAVICHAPVTGCSGLVLLTGTFCLSAITLLGWFPLQ